MKITSPPKEITSVHLRLRASVTGLPRPSPMYHETWRCFTTSHGRLSGSRSVLREQRHDGTHFEHERLGNTGCTRAQHRLDWAGALRIR